MLNMLACLTVSFRQAGSLAVAVRRPTFKKEINYG